MQQARVSEFGRLRAPTKLLGPVARVSLVLRQSLCGAPCLAAGTGLSSLVQLVTYIIFQGSILLLIRDLDLAALSCKVQMTDKRTHIMNTITRHDI